MKEKSEGIEATKGRAASEGAFDAVSCALESVKLELIAEAYSILKSAVRASHDEMRTVFAEWNRGELADPLVAAAADVLGLRDEDGDPLLEKVLDVSRGPELGVAAAALALELGVPAPIITHASFSSFLSAMKDERIDASAVLSGPKPGLTGERHVMIEEIRKALLASLILAYAEAYALLAASGCGSQAALGGEGSALAVKAAEANQRQGAKGNLLLDAHIKSALDPVLPSLRRICSRCADVGVRSPCLSASLIYYDGLRSTWLPANMVVALRDRREGSGFERVDRPRGEVFHSEWK